MQKQEKQISTLKSKVRDLTTRSMAKNVLISGLMGDEHGEDCVQKVKQFCVSKLKMQIQDGEIEVAHRLGPKSVGKNQELWW